MWGAPPRHILPGTRPRRIVYTLSAYLLLTAAADSTFDLYGPCTKRKLGCDDASIVGLLSTALVFISFTTTAGLGCHKFYRVTLRRRWVTRQPGHWTLAASRGVFHECAALVRSAQNAALTLMGAITVIGATSRFLVALEDPYEGDQEFEEGVIGVCGPDSSSLCHLCFISYRAVFMATSGLMLYIVCIYILTPAAAWSPVFQEAARQERDRRHTRLPIFSWVVAVLGFSAFGLAAYLTLFLAAYSVTAGGAVRYFWATVGLLAGEVAAIVWFNDLYHLQRALPLLQQYGRKLASTVRGAGAVCCSGRVEGDGLWSRHQSVSFAYESSLRFQQFVVLVLNIFLWTFSAKTGALFYDYTMWACRLVCTAYFVLGRDAPANFHDLLEDPGFGLVADKRDLCKALGVGLSGKQFHGAVRRYKASSMRMQETMAVSYRWQEGQVELCKDFGFNMSRWQMTELLRALQRSNCMYVWIDHISIPQSGFSDMKRTLLARMMAAYASAGFTLVLRSLELDESRYHQRGWTMQEYCTSSQLIVRTEAGGAADLESSFAAVRGAEEARAVALREQQLATTAQRRPMWLSGSGIGDIPLVEVLQREALYGELAQKLHTEIPADMVRALYPLVWDRPVESHEELMELVRQVSARMAEVGDYAGTAEGDLRLLLSSYSTTSTALQRVRSRVGTGDGEASAPLERIIQASSRKASSRLAQLSQGPDGSPHILLVHRHSDEQRARAMLGGCMPGYVPEE
eukprot:jgi/Tetstr1/453364/TSEL_040354.t1